MKYYLMLDDNWSSEPAYVRNPEAEAHNWADQLALEKYQAQDEDDDIRQGRIQRKSLRKITLALRAEFVAALTEVDSIAEVRETLGRKEFSRLLRRGDFGALYEIRSSKFHGDKLVCRSRTPEAAVRQVVGPFGSVSWDGRPWAGENQGTILEN